MRSVRLVLVLALGLIGSSASDSSAAGRRFKGGAAARSAATRPVGKPAKATRPIPLVGSTAGPGPFPAAPAPEAIKPSPRRAKRARAGRPAPAAAAVEARAVASTSSAPASAALASPPKASKARRGPATSGDLAELLRRDAEGQARADRAAGVVAPADQYVVVPGKKPVASGGR